ncbi:MAG: IclR family transcriptional regulator [Acidimicrobiales bacterium]
MSSGAVAKSFRVLEMLSSAHHPVRLSEVAAECDLQKSTAHRVLAELVELGYVRQEVDSGRYLPTLRTWELGTAVVADLPIKQVASTALHALHARTGETVSLVVRSGDDALYLDKIVSPRPVRFTTRVGSRLPLPVPAGGMALLSVADDASEVVDRVIARRDLALVLDPAAVARSLVRARERGYAIVASTSITSIAAPVLDRAGRPAAALAVSAPTDRVTDDVRAAIADEVVTTATRLSESLGRL